MDKLCPVPSGTSRSIARRNQIAWSRVQTDETVINAENNHGTIVGVNKAHIEIHFHFGSKEED